MTQAATLPDCDHATREEADEEVTVFADADLQRRQRRSSTAQDEAVCHEEAATSDHPDAVSSQTEEEVRPATASDAASRALLNAAFIRLNVSGKTMSRKKGGTTRIVLLITVAIEGAAQGVAWSVGLWLRAMRYRTVQTCVAAAVLACAGVVGWKFVEPRLPVSADTVLADYNRVWKQLQAAHESDETSAERWEQIRSEMRAGLATSAEKLQRQATSGRPELQELMWASEHFPAALREAQESNNGRSAQRRLAIHLSNAEAAMSRRAELTASGSPATTSGYSESRMFYAVIAIGIVILGWLIRLLLRSDWLRRRSHHAS